MKKYLVTLNDKTIEIEIKELVDNELMPILAKKFDLIGSFGIASPLMFIKLMDIYTFTISKRGMFLPFIIKEVKEEKSKTYFDFDEFKTNIENLCLGKIDEFSLNMISKDILENFFEELDFQFLDSETDDDETTYFYALDSEDWKLIDSDDYINRLNVKFNISEMLITFSLEESSDVFISSKELKEKVSLLREKVSLIEAEINNLALKLDDLAFEKDKIINDIEELIDEQNFETYY